MRQYIGARYVPKFYQGSNGNEWDGSSVPYEPLTIVTHLNNSYTSKKEVPVGVDITNTEYWVMTAAYNAQVEQYRQEVDDYKEEVNRFTTHKYLFIGDSFATLTNNWVSLLVNYLGLSNSDYDTIAEAGIGFNGRGIVSNKNILGLLTDYVNASSVEALESFTDVIIQSGANDTATGLATAMSDTMTYINSNLPNAKIKIFYTATFFNPISDRVKQLRQAKLDVRYVYANAVRSGKNVCVFQYADMCLNWNMLTVGDGIHPGDIGNRNLASYILEMLNGNQTYEPTTYQTEYGDLKLNFKNLNGRYITVEIKSWLTVNAKTFDALSDTKITAYNSSNPIPACPTLGNVWLIPLAAIYSNQGGSNQGTSNLYLKIDGNGDVYITNNSSSAITCNFMNPGSGAGAVFDMSI